MKSAFLKNIAEWVYKIQDKPLVANAEGKAVPGGLAGAHLQAMDEDRMATLQAKFSETPLGAALLAYGAEKGAYFSFSRHDEESGSVVRSKITLNAYESDDKLIGVMAHELRHFWQHSETGHAFITKTEGLAPETRIAILRFKEADAFSFEQKYLEDYAARTGKRGPLEESAKNVSAPEGLNDTDRFMAYAEEIKSGGFYDCAEIANINDDIRLRHEGNGEKSVLLSEQKSEEAALKVARTIDGSWPFAPKAGESGHYLSGISDKNIMQAGEPWRIIQKDVQSLTNAHKADFAKQASLPAPAVSVSVAPK